MIVLPTLRALLKQTLGPPEVHTAAVFTPPGALISYATTARASPAAPQRAFSKDDVRLLVGLATEIWAEARGAGSAVGMAECEVSAGARGPAGASAPQPSAAASASADAAAAAPTPLALTSSRQPQLGRIVVVPVYSAAQLNAPKLPARTPSPSPTADGERDASEPLDDPGPQPPLLLAVQGTIDADWDDLVASAQSPADELAGPLDSYGTDLLQRETSPPPPPPPPPATAPRSRWMQQ